MANSMERERGLVPEEGEVNEKPVEAGAEAEAKDGIRGDQVIAEMSPEVDKAQGLIDQLRFAVDDPEYNKTKAYLDSTIRDDLKEAIQEGGKGMSDFHKLVAKAFGKKGISRKDVDEMHKKMEEVIGGLEEAKGLVSSLRNLLAMGNKGEAKEVDDGDEMKEAA